MSVSKMCKIQLTTVKDGYDQVIDILHSTGAVEIEQIADVAEKDLFRPESKAEYWQTNVKFALGLLEQHKDEVKKSFAQKLAGDKQEVTDEQIVQLEQSFDYKRVIAELENLDKEYNTVKNRISQNRKEIRFLKEWQGLPIYGAYQGRFVVFSVGTIPVMHYDEFRQKCFDAKTIDCLKLNETEKEVRVLIVSTVDDDERMQVMFEAYDFKAAEFTLNGAKTIEERLEKLNRSIEEDEKRLEASSEKIKKHTPHIEKFKVLFDYLTWKKEQDEAMKQSLATFETVTLVGWIAEQHLVELRQQLDKVTDEYAIDELEIAEDENVPIVLRNSELVAPFESVTEIYGAPLYNEPDPTILLAPFFFLYFGLCLSDAGYGLLLALLAYVAIKFLKPGAGAKKLMKLMIYGGLATFIAGALFGGWFGIALESFPAPISQALQAIRIVDPVQNPMSVMIMSFILGFIQLVFGNALDAWWKIKQGRVMDGICGGGVWAVFLLIIGFWISIKAGVLPEGLTMFSNILLVIGLLGLVATQGRDKKNPFMKVAAGVGSLYGLVGYLSDILSYSRLLALGLSTGIIAMVVNLVADLFAGMVPFVGWLVWILIIVGGHLFNLIINVLGAFIHAGRLQFVEYFPKFLVGGGRKFKPLVKQAKYITFNK